MRRTRLIIVALCVVAGGCAGGSATPPSGASAPARYNIVLKGSELTGTLLDGMRTRLPSMVVSTENTTCPAITFRGVRSARNQGDPSVYVDGTLMADTCILQQINSNDVERVVVYPGGQAAEPGIRQNASGIIMVYRVRD